MPRNIYDNLSILAESTSLNANSTQIHERLGTLPVVHGSGHNDFMLLTPVDVRDQDISIDGEVGDRRQRHAVLVLLQFLLKLSIIEDEECNQFNIRIYGKKIMKSLICNIDGR